MKSYSLKDKSVLITGASSGIGEALAIELSNQVKSLVLMARNTSKLKMLADKLSGVCQVYVNELDLCSGSSIVSAQKFIEEHKIELDIIVHNAGISQRSKASKTNKETEEKIWKTNYRGPIELTKLLLPELKKQKRSKLILISSIVEVFGYPLRSTYSATKHAIKGYFESLAFEEYDNGVEVQFILPGRVKTKISNNALKADGTKHDKLDAGQETGVSSEYCAREIVKAIEKGKKQKLIGGKELIMVKLYKYFRRLFVKVAQKELLHEN